MECTPLNGASVLREPGRNVLEAVDLGREAAEPFLQALVCLDGAVLHAAAEVVTEGVHELRSLGLQLGPSLLLRVQQGPESLLQPEFQVGLRALASVSDPVPPTHWQALRRTVFSRNCRMRSLGSMPFRSVSRSFLGAVRRWRMAHRSATLQSRSVSSSFSMLSMTNLAATERHGVVTPARTRTHTWHGVTARNALLTQHALR